MVPINRIENFIRRAIWRLTRTDSIIKYIPKSIHNGVVVGDCAVIRNKKHTFDVYSKDRRPIKKDICNHKIAICMATVMNQYTGNLDQTLKKLNALDNEYAFALGNYHRFKAKIDANPHLQNDFDRWETKVIELSNEIEALFESMTI